MNRDRFIRQRRNDWQLLEALLVRLRELRTSRWSSDDIESLARLYRSVCCDLSLVQSREWGRRLELYLNDLVAQGHSCLYRSRPGSLRTLSDFVLRGFPRLLRKHSVFFLAATALFFLPLIVATLTGMVDPVLVERLVPREALEQSLLSYQDEVFERVDEGFLNSRSLMTGFYVWNNVGIAFRAFAMGILAGVGTVYTLLHNGLMIGGVTGYLIHHGCGDNFFSFAISHGSFELTAIAVAGGAGLLMGWGIVHPGQRTRMASLQHHGREAIQLAFGAGVMLAVAAAIEAWFSPLPIPHSLKYVVGTALWCLVICWLALAGREAPDAD